MMEWVLFFTYSLVLGLCGVWIGKIVSDRWWHKELKKAIAEAKPISHVEIRKKVEESLRQAKKQRESEQNGRS